MSSLLKLIQLGIIGMMLVGIFGCDEGPVEEAGDAIEETTDEAQDAVEDAAD